jgi:very-short-patch-repair endonuclease
VKDGAAVLAQQLAWAHHTGWVRELRFHPVRKWRFDLAHPGVQLAVEVEGGVWRGGRHTRGTGFSSDCEKYAEALILGWSVLRVTTDQVKSGQALQWIERAITWRDA